MHQVKNGMKKKKPFALKVPMCFPTMSKPDRLTVLEWFVREGDVIEPPLDINNLPPLLNVDAPYYGGSEILLPVPEFLSIAHRVTRILKPAQSTVQLGDELILLEPLEDNKETFIAMPQDIHQLLEQYENDANLLYALHQKYISNEWGTFQLTGETYRQMGEKDWIAAQGALEQLKEQAKASIPLLQRTSLSTLLSAMQGMRIRLCQRFAEITDDLSIQEDSAKADSLWQDLNQVDRALYQQLG